MRGIHSPGQRLRGRIMIKGRESHPGGKRMTRTAVIVFLVISLATLGCGSKLPPGAKPTRKVTVTVTYKGAPVEKAVVTFVNQEGPPTANGRTDAQGKVVVKTY